MMKTHYVRSKIKDGVEDVEIPTPLPISNLETAFSWWLTQSATRRIIVELNSGVKFAYYACEAPHEHKFVCECGEETAC